MRNERADERTRTAYPCSLRVGLRLSRSVPSCSSTWLTEGEYSASVTPPVLLRTDPYQPGCSTGCSTPISRRLSLLRVAAHCTVLRSRWSQSGVNSRCRLLTFRPPNHPSFYSVRSCIYS